MSVTVEAYPIDPLAFPRARPPRTGRRAFGQPRRGHAHAGVDLLAPEGTEVGAVASGRVAYVMDRPERDCGYGIAIDSDDGHRWTYCHFRDPVEGFERRQRVDAGDALGVVGRSGNARNTGPHLHLAAVNLETGEPVDVTDVLEQLYDFDRADASPASTRTDPSPVRARAPSPPRRSSAGGGLVLGLLALVAFRRGGKRHG